MNSINLTGPNGTWTSKSIYCNPSVGHISFNMTRNGTIAGTLSATGPFALWLVPSGMDCEVVYYKLLANQGVSCPPLFGVLPPYSWNLTTIAAGSINLSAPSSGSSGGPGVIQPSYWEFVIANTGSTAESVTVSSSITLSFV